MRHHVIVTFGRDKQYEYKVIGGTPPDEARQWLSREFEALECDVATPTGKILAVDRILSVAKYAGEGRFREQQGWAEQFAKYTGSLLGRDLIRVDVENYSIGY